MKTLLFACGLLLAGPISSQAHRAGLPADAATYALEAARQHGEGYDRQRGGGYDRQRTARPAIQLNLGASRPYHRPYHRGYRVRQHYAHNH